MKVLLFSDLHLDSKFAWAGPGAARVWRRQLREVLERIVVRAQQPDIDAVLCGGDLYEHERFTPDTVEFVRGCFERLHPVPVFVSPGNHDWIGAESLYERAGFSPNVHLFKDDRLVPVELADGLSLWGAAHRKPANTAGFLDDFQVDRSGVNVALFHGSEAGLLRFQGDDKVPHAPFRADQIERAGLDHAFLGHYHRPRTTEHLTYPGNTNPLSFGEDGERGIVIADIDGTGGVTCARESVSVTELHDLELDVTPCASQQDVLARYAETLRPLSGFARVTLTGELAQEVDLREDDFEKPAGMQAVRVRFSPQLRVAYDYEALRREETVRGQFVGEVLDDPDLDEAQRRAVLVTGLRALEGRPDLDAL